jgi:23S rRNA (guanine745-N1)-methyltransferase
VLRCRSGHAFDRAREGYWNLLQPQDRRSRSPGDSDAAVEARGRWLERGFAAGLAAAVARAARLDELPPGASGADVGCGDGWFDERLFGARAADLCGIDLAARALRLAARRLPAATWVVANADRFLPFSDGSIDVALSIFGRRPAAELTRVLRPGGRLIVALPADDDLLELRGAALGDAALRERAAGAIAELQAAGLRLAGRQRWSERHLHDIDAALDALAMTYRGERHAERRRLDDSWPRSGGLEVTLAADLLVFSRA